MTSAALPFIDEHRIHISASADRTYAELARVAIDGLAKHPAPSAFVALWQLEPVSGFAVAERTAPTRVVLRGRHRFSDYELAFEIDSEREGGVTLRARTSAVFPGILGWIYRTLVIGTRGHVVVVRRILKTIARRAERIDQGKSDASTARK